MNEMLSMLGKWGSICPSIRFELCSKSIHLFEECLPRSIVCIDHQFLNDTRAIVDAANLRDAWILGFGRLQSRAHCVAHPKRLDHGEPTEERRPGDQKTISAREEGWGVRQVILFGHGKSLCQLTPPVNC